MADQVTSILSEFKATLSEPDLINTLRAGLIGDDAMIDGPFGPRPLIYADYVASGRALRQVETFVMDRILPYYANSHTEASWCGSFCTRARNSARAEIARIIGATDDYSVVFAGAGATAGINRLVLLLDIPAMLRAGKRVIVLAGPYEHHSNLLPWRDSGAEVIEIDEATRGGPDMVHLHAALEHAQIADLIIGAFSAASNVTGILTDTVAITRLLKQFNALAIWDYGAAAPYVPIEMHAGSDHAKDAVVWSSHKFPGGPGASGVMVVRDSIRRRATPTLPGGGTVSFVSPWEHVYSDDLVHREEGGTPNVIGDIRAALVLMIKEAMGTDWLADRQEALRQRARTVWRKNSRIEMMGLDDPDAALPIFSFRVRDGKGGYVHHQQFTRMLSDIYGIQARGGCACAGSYAHRLLGITKDQSAALLTALREGRELEKPGWTRLNFSALMSDEKAAKIVADVDRLAREAARHMNNYRADNGTARFIARLPAQ